MQDRRSPAEGDAQHCCGEARRRQGNGANGDPDKVAMDKNGANNAAIDAINAGRAVPPLVRHSHTSITSSNRITAPSSG